MNKQYKSVAGIFSLCIQGRMHSPSIITCWSGRPGFSRI